MARRGLDPNTLLMLAAIAGGGYVVLQAVGALKFGKDKLQTIGEAIGGGLFEFFHPNATGEMLYYNVAFPGGTRHAIPSKSVSAAGIFTWEGDGKRYQLLVDKTKAAGINKTAFPL